MKKILGMISRLFLEEVEEKTVYDEKTNKITSRTTTVISNEPPKPVQKEKPENKPVKKAETISETKPKETISESKSEPTFLNVSTSNSPVTAKTVTVKKEKSVYVPTSVISPIFGSDKELYNTKTNNYVYENSSTTTKSVLNTVFSPINGDCATTVKETTAEIDERIANMTIDDFLTEIDENQIKRLQPPHGKVNAALEADMEKTIKEEPLTIENLSLFDDFKES
ncbi:MAG: hypothetical protein ACI4WG_01770 [Erysipelotrichaceae bacterium]